MRYNKFGTTDWDVSKICLGTMTFGEQNTEAEAHEQLDYAREAGINIFDTAELYSVPARPETQGNSERHLGSWIEKRGVRDDIFVATKIGGPAAMAKHLRDKLDFSRASLEFALSRSLDNLRTDYVDLYQLHWPERSANFFNVRGVSSISGDAWQDNFLSVLESMDALIRSGRIRAWGLSNETPWGLMRLLHLADVHGLPRPVSIQNPYSLLNRNFEVGLSEICLRENIAGFPYSPLAMGRLSGKYLRGEDTPENRLNRWPHYNRYNSPVALEATAAYAEVAERHELSLTQLSLAFVNDRAFNQSNIIGATNLEQLKENLGSIDLQLSGEVLEDLEGVQARYPNPAA